MYCSSNQEVGDPVDISWKVTTSGEQPETVTAVKFAIGACAETNVPVNRIIQSVIHFRKIELINVIKGENW